jgi:hypothetical protein
MSPFEEACKKIQDLYADMKELTLAAGVQESTYNKVLETHPDITLEEIQNRLTFLEAVRKGPYADLNYTWLLLPPSVWQGYLDMGIRNYPEQKRLRDQRKVIKEVWKQKYETGRLRKLTDEELEEDAKNLHSSKTDELSGGTGSSNAS